MKSSRQITRAARRLFRLCLVNGTVDEARTRDVARRIALSGRRGSRWFFMQVFLLGRLYLGRNVALVARAAPLPYDVQETVSAGLTGIYGPSVKPTFVVTPALVGGMRIKVGSEVYDGSVRARLAALEARL